MFSIQVFMKKEILEENHVVTYGKKNMSTPKTYSRSMLGEQNVKSPLKEDINCLPTNFLLLKIISLSSPKKLVKISL